MGFASGAVVTLPSSTETALIAQGLATASTASIEPSIYGGPDQFVTIGGNITSAPSAGQTVPVVRQGPSTIVNAFLPAALTTYETNGVAQTAGTWNYAEIFVQAWTTFTGAGWLNGTTVGTNNGMVALWGSDGTLLANSAVAGALTAGASTFQNAAFTAPITLSPGRYFVGLQLNGNTDTVRHILAAACPNGTGGIMTGSVAGVFGTPAATLTIANTFTSAAGPIMQLYM
jgi:hypothetical protein